MKTRWMAALGGAFMLAACSTPPRSVDVANSAWASRSAGEPIRLAWEHYTFPGKAATEFTAERQEGRDAVLAQASSAASMLRARTRVEPEQLGRVRFSWKVPALMAKADLASRELDDAPVRVVLVFEGDRSRFSPRDAMLSELVRAVTGEELPYATLMYVWCNKREPGSVVRSPRTDRIRTLVVESGEARLNRWIDYERDVRADYVRAFGEEPGALVGIGLMTDSDNTRSVTRAWYGPIQLLRLAAAR